MTKSEEKKSEFVLKNTTDFQNEVFEKSDDNENNLIKEVIETHLSTENHVAENVDSQETPKADLIENSASQANIGEVLEQEYASVKQTKTELTLNMQLVNENYDIVGTIPKPTESENIYNKFEIPVEDDYNITSTNHAAALCSTVAITDNEYDNLNLSS